ncbi:MAG: exodeoxyribonuclease VII small subunit [Clostridiales bacterium]|jgi:exodeoxyribonuclease VII small subunit|nr:exodeoxyribonuclease VII small subunit [Clostridiales bacterium]
MKPKKEISKSQEVPNFEVQLDQLKNIVSELQKNDTSIECGIKAFSEGLVLAKSCLDILNNYKGKITELKMEADKLIESELVL